MGVYLVLSDFWVYLLPVLTGCFRQFVTDTFIDPTKHSQTGFFFCFFGALWDLNLTFSSVKLSRTADIPPPIHIVKPESGFPPLVKTKRL